MNTFITTWFIARFWASPHRSMDLLFSVRDVRAERKAQKIKVYDPGFPRDDPLAEPPFQPARPIPTDVPVPEPRDVPVPEPIDVPPPDPGEVPPVVEPQKSPGQNPKPRPVP